VTKLELAAAILAIAVCLAIAWQPRGLTIDWIFAGGAFVGAVAMHLWHDTKEGTGR
jgi:hypothetical protein